MNETPKNDLNLTNDMHEELDNPSSALQSMRATIHLASPVRVEAPITHGHGATDPRTSDSDLAENK